MLNCVEHEKSFITSGPGDIKINIRNISGISILDIELKGCCRLLENDSKYSCLFYMKMK